MPTYPHIEQYRAYLQQLKDFGGSDNELSIRPAFQNCLDAYCREHREKLGLVPELSAGGGEGAYWFIVDNQEALSPSPGS